MSNDYNKTVECTSCTACVIPYYSSFAENVRRKNNGKKR